MAVGARAREDGLDVWRNLDVRLECLRGVDRRVRASGAHYLNRDEQDEQRQ